MKRFSVIERYTVERVFYVEAMDEESVSKEWDSILDAGTCEGYLAEEEWNGPEETMIEPLD